jgi:hypothetical protein
MRMNRLPLLAALLLVALPLASAEGEEALPEPELVPGELDVIEMTAVALDGRLPGPVEPTAFRWRILDGTGGKLFGEDREDAVFLAPKVERGVKEFLIELTVMYAEEPPSTRQLRIRVLPSDPAAALEGADEDDAQWLKDLYRREPGTEEQKSAPTVSGGRSGPSVSIGVGAGSGGYRGAGVGFRWSMSYPISQPVDVPPPGQTYVPGEGAWGSATPVPRERIPATFPASIAERYGLEDQPASSEAEPKED